MRASFLTVLVFATTATYAAPFFPPPLPHGNGGSAYTGSTGNVNGGDVINDGYWISNGYGANKAGSGGVSWSGDAFAGNGGYFGGNGGSAYTGSTGNANGGSVINTGAFISNAGGASEYP
ncbi:hypothetical protein BXZ70DRAFT_927956 [Cristinia sonorae]|uniref:Uncharacterized protein n=1 Tax=Cristinia sonorae TaxID=1940300 RepID=A0A8K0USG5_9AGAR|nr:hypothetical protein BXZ70DRAFT_927956 [Cristinia sonorae]